MGRSKNHSARTYQGRSLRKLRFDSLEDRRLLAGLSVFVFDDANSSSSIDSGEVGRSNQVVFLDEDGNQRLDPLEKWMQTGADGKAVFSNLDPGDYFPVLFGNRSDTTQTTPVAPSQSGQTHPISNVKNLLGWKSETQVWLSFENSIDLFDIQSNESVESTPFQGKLISAALNSSDGSGLILLENANGSRSLSWIDLNEHKVTSIVASKGLGWEKVGRTSLGYFAHTNALLDSTSIVVLQSNSQNISPLPGAVFEPGTTVYGSENGPYLFTTKQSLSIESNGTLLRSFRLEQGRAIQFGSRLFSSSIEVQSIDPLGKLIALRDGASKTIIVENNAGMTEAMVFAETASLVSFDRSQGIVASYSPTDSMVSRRRIGSWEQVDRFKPLASLNTQSLLGQLSIAPNGHRLLALNSEGLYSHVLNERTKLVVSLPKIDSVAQAVLGTKIEGTNSAPSIQTVLPLESPEDAILLIDSKELTKRFADSENDSLAYFVISAPRYGQLQWSPSQGGIYQPNSDFEGNDQVVLQAFDGRNWSTALSLPIHITPVNDRPSGFEFDVPSFGENSIAGTELGLVTVLDPDRDASYRVTVDDSRLLVMNGILKIADGAKFDFESESSFTFEIIATDDSHPEDTLVRTVTVDILDQNDAPTDIQFDFQDLPENLDGGIVGAVYVADQDQGESFRWLVSDSRFQIVDGKLVLQADASVDFESQSQIPITLTAADRNGNGATITKTTLVHVKNENDPTLGIRLDKQAVVEKVRGFQVGKITVVDEDRDETFIFNVSDDRFVISDNVLKLKPNIFIDGAGKDIIPIDITATSQLTGESYTQSVQLQVMSNSNPWRNSSNPLDVDGDGRISVIDPLRIINHINRFGIHDLNAPPDNVEGEIGNDFFDVNGDGKVSPIDIIIVINHLNQNAGGSSGGSSGGSNGGSGGGGGVGEGESSSMAAIQPSIIDSSLSSYLEDIAKDHEMGPRRNRKR